MSGDLVVMYYVYLLVNKPRKVFYVGITDDLVRRIWEHKAGIRDGFTKKYNVNRLVYFEEIADAEKAMAREKRLKRWNREWKMELVEKENPQWSDLYNVICEQDPRSHSLCSFGGELC